MQSKPRFKLYEEEFKEQLAKERYQQRIEIKLARNPKIRKETIDKFEKEYMNLIKDWKYKERPKSFNSDWTVLKTA